MAGGARKAAGKAMDAAETEGSRLRDKLPGWVKRTGDYAADWAADKFGRGVAKGISPPKA